MTPPGGASASLPGNLAVTGLCVPTGLCAPTGLCVLTGLYVLTGLRAPILLCGGVVVLLFPPAARHAPHPLVGGLGFGVWGLGFGFWGSGLGVLGLGSGVWGSPWAEAG